MTATNPLTNVIEWGDISVTPGIKLWLKAYKIATGAAHIINDVIKNLLTTPAIVVAANLKSRASPDLQLVGVADGLVGCCWLEKIEDGGKQRQWQLLSVVAAAASRSYCCRWALLVDAGGACWCRLLLLLLFTVGGFCLLLAASPVAAFCWKEKEEAEERRKRGAPG